MPRIERGRFAQRAARTWKGWQRRQIHRRVALGLAHVVAIRGCAARTACVVLAALSKASFHSAGVAFQGTSSAREYPARRSGNAPKAEATIAAPLAIAVLSV